MRCRGDVDTARVGARGHLVRLAPALIQCIGRGEGSEALELQVGVREALAAVATELHL